MKPKEATKHKTTHAERPDADGKVFVRCETCDWRDAVDVSGLSWAEGMVAIFAARDRHEADAAKVSPARP